MPNRAPMNELDSSTVFMEGVAEILALECIMWDYNGHRPGAPEVPAVHLTIATEEGNTTEEFLSVGNAEDFAPSADGKTFDLVGNRTRFHERSRWGALLKSLVDLKYPTKLYNPDDYTCLVGLKGHLSTIVLIKADDRVKKDVTALIFDKITQLPGEGKSAAESGIRPKSDIDVDEVASSILLSILSEGDEVKKSALMSKAVQDDTLKGLNKVDKTAVLARLRDDEFLSQCDGWAFESNVLSLA